MTVNPQIHLNTEEHAEEEAELHNLTSAKDPENWILEVKQASYCISLRSSINIFTFLVEKTQSYLSHPSLSWKTGK